MPFVTDENLAYRASETQFPPGSILRFDEAYRRAHLPLVAPDHPDVIREDLARGYAMGRHEMRWSLVVPVSWDALSASPAFQALEAELRASPIAGKMAWDIEASAGTCSMPRSVVALVKALLQMRASGVRRCEKYPLFPPCCADCSRGMSISAGSTSSSTPRIATAMPRRPPSEPLGDRDGALPHGLAHARRLPRRN